MTQLAHVTTSDTRGGALALLRDCIALTRPRVLTLVLLTAPAGLVLGQGTWPAFTTLLGVLIGTALVGGGCSALNAWYERDRDALMLRTLDRPLPAGRLTPNQALGFGLLVCVLGLGALNAVGGWLPVAVGSLTLAHYIFVYTMWLKRRTAQNIVIGGAAGAFPPMIGWAMVSGDISWVGFVLFGLIFLWTPPHFWALALVKESEYGAVKVPMLPNVVGAQETKRQIVIYTAAMSLIGLVPFVLGAAGYIYFVVALAFGGLFMINAWQLLRGDSLAPAKRMFGFSIFYLFLLFGLLLVDARSHVSLTWL